MKIKYLFLTALLLAVTTVGFAQKRKATATVAADQVVKNLYAAQKIEKTNPFAQIKSRALVDKYFTKELADLVWKTNRATGDDGWRHIDVLYDSHEQLRDALDPQITNLTFGKPVEESGPDDVFLKVTFKNHGEAQSVMFNLRREANKIWKIADINYSEGDDLSYMLRYRTDAEYKKEYDTMKTFRGSYTVGAMTCDVVPTMSRFEFFHVRCDGQDGFKIYAVDGDETQTSYVHTDDKGKETGKFVFKGDETDGKFFDAAGKEVKVTSIKNDEPPTSNPTPASDPEIENVSGQLQVGKTESVILYVGPETGDYAAYCFTNASDAGRAILAKCKTKDECEVRASLGGDERACKVPGLEASLSASFRISKVASVKSLGRRK